MRIVVVDVETFKYDWITVFYDISKNIWSVFHNNSKAVLQYMTQPDVIFCGFNNKHYDNHILKAICCGADNLTVKSINDFIIVDDRNGWDHYFIRKNRFWFHSFDLMDDTQVGTSLKHIEAHLGMDIEESEVDFNLDRPLTPEEITKTIRYCKYDVARTANLLTLRKGYLDAKLNVGRSIGLPDHKALYMTNARLTAEALNAKATKRYDEREYQYPANLERNLIPAEVLAFFDRMHDKTIPDKELFSSSLTIDVDGAEAVIAFGGIHHAQPCYHEIATGTRVIRNFDVASLYPSLMVYNGYTSRNIPSSEIFEDFYHTRLEAKRNGDKKTANTLKLILNTTYGASLASTNPLYDPLMGRSVCITGQLYILELAQRYLAACKTLRIIQLNTDGLMISLESHELPIVYRLNEEWQRSKHLELEEDKIKAIHQKDVNNYVMVFENDKVKTKGGYVSYGIAPAGAFSINNNHTIVKEAVINYFVHGTPVEETIYHCDDIHKFQIVAKAGEGYKFLFSVPPDYEEWKELWQKANSYKVPNGFTKTGKPRFKTVKPPFKWHNYDGPRQEVQRVNRVYASPNTTLGSIVKVKPDGTVGKIGGLPDNCIIDNKNKLTLADVDRTWYVNLAKKYIADYTAA